MNWSKLIRLYVVAFICAGALIASACGSAGPTFHRRLPSRNPIHHHSEPGGTRRPVRFHQSEPRPMERRSVPDCNLANRWHYEQTLRNTGGTTLTISDRADFFNGVQVRYTLRSWNRAGAGRRTPRITTQWCSANNIEHQRANKLQRIGRRRQPRYGSPAQRFVCNQDDRRGLESPDMCGIAGIVATGPLNPDDADACALHARRHDPPRPGRRRPVRRRPRRARPPPPQHRRPRRRASAAVERGRDDLGHLQRRDLQPRRRAAAARSRPGIAIARAPTPRRSSTPTSSGATTACSASAACSRSRSGTRRGGGCCWCATGSASSRSTGRRAGRPRCCSRPRSRRFSRAA